MEKKSLNITSYQDYHRIVPHNVGLKSTLRPFIFTKTIVYFESFKSGTDF